ncbi:MAG: hypothetical protein K2X99_02590, partial [Gemmatimonadaceae bacterium]|nr:hypothetical protein [Gemmatimonadaceae bacterium]
LNGNDTVSVVLESVTSAVRMVATDGRATSDTTVIDAVDRPFLGEVVATVRFPAYLDRADERVDATAPLRVPRGVTLSVHGQATVPLARVLLRGAGAPITFAPSGSGFDGALPAVDGSYVWEVTARGGGAVDVPAPLRIETIPDSAPDLELVAPSRDSVVSAQGEVPILVAAHDDHALASVALRVWKVGVAGATTPTETRIGAPQGSDYAGGATLRLEAFALQPGDALHVLPVARDASPWRQEGRGRELVLRLPSVNEEREIARALADSAVQRATDAARAQQGLQRRTQEEARARTPRDARPNDAQLKFGDAERAKALAAEQRTMQQRTEQLQKQVQSVQDHLKGAGVLDSSLARLLGEAQRMLKEAMTPELRAALEQAEKAGDQLDATRSKQSMAELAAQQQRMKEALERSAEMLKRAALEGAMSTVRDAARDLAKAQAAAADSAERGMGTDASRRAQAARTESLARDAEQLRKRLSQARADTAARAADLAARQARRAAEALKDSTGGATRSREAAKQLEAAAQSLQTGREAQVGAWKEEVTDDLDRAVQEMMQMAREQDLLAAESKQLRSGTGMQAKQGALKQGAESSMQRVERTSRKSAMLSPKTQRAMQDAQSKLDQATRDAGQSGGGKEGGITSMQEAADALRQAAAALARDRERAAAAGSASGVPEMLAQLQQAADQQSGVNSQMQSLLQMAAQAGKAGGPSEAAARQAARDAAKAQREVARALDDAADADATGKAEALAREARQVAQTLEQGATDPGVLARQQRLLRRMLDAGRVLEQEDQKEDGKREAKSGAGIAPFTPTRGAARGAAAERYAPPDWNALRSLDAADRRVVLEYFRRLNGTTP